MSKKKVVVLALHNELESAYPPLNISVGAAASGADVLLAFLRDGVDLVNPQYIPCPSASGGYLANALSDVGAASIQELLELARDLGVRMVTVEADGASAQWELENKPIKWILNEAVRADLFVHF